MPLLTDPSAQAAVATALAAPAGSLGHMAASCAGRGEGAAEQGIRTESNSQISQGGDDSGGGNSPRQEEEGVAGGRHPRGEPGEAPENEDIGADDSGKFQYCNLVLYSYCRCLFVFRLLFLPPVAARKRQNADHETSFHTTN